MSLGLLVGCGLGDRAARAERVIDSVDLLAADGPAAGTLAVSIRLLEAPVNIPVQAGTFDGPPIDMVVDVDAERAALGPAGDPQQIFDGLVIFGRRLAAAEGDARPWMKLDLEGLADGDSKVNFEQLAPEALRNALNPSFVVDLIAGALSGSVDKVGPDDVGGTPTTRYDGNFDIEKAVEDTRRTRYPEREREALYDELKLLGMSGRVFPGSVWLDAEGKPRRFQVGVRVSPRKGFVLELGLDLTFLARATELVPPSPSDLELLETDSLGGYLYAVTPTLAGQ